MRRTTFFLFALLVLLGGWMATGCSDKKNPTSTAVPTDTPTAVPTPVPTVTVLDNRTLGSDPHAIDFYRASNATSAIVFLHGGGGKKEGMAYSLGIKNDNTDTDYDVSTSGASWLIANKVMAVFPQGQSAAGNNWTWDNDVMVSGVNDIAFLQTLVADMKADPTNAAITRYYLAGHSNGGMMANRMWCESPGTFDAYGALAGPPSPHLDPTAGSDPCSPTVVKPYIGVVGDSDAVLQTTGNMSAAAWFIKPILVTNPAVWVDATPSVLNETLFNPSRVTLRCSGTMAAPVTTGSLIKYSDCSGAIQLLVIVGGDHCLSTPSWPCSGTLAGTTGLDLKTVLFDFFRGF